MMMMMIYLINKQMKQMRKYAVILSFL